MTADNDQGLTHRILFFHQLNSLAKAYNSLLVVAMEIGLRSLLADIPEPLQ